MKKTTDFVGRRFDRLLVIEYGYKINSKNFWLCLCDCGNKKYIRQSDLVCNKIKSCGCLMREKSLERINHYNIINKKYNTYIKKDGYIIGVCQNKPVEFYIDEDDFDLIKNYYWYLDNRNYICTKINNKVMRLQNIILFHDDKYVVDHIDGNTYNNRRQNLRICTQEENTRNRTVGKNNTSGIKGVVWNKILSKWEARINYKNKRIRIGVFGKFKDAVNARIEAEQKYFGEYSYLNRPNVNLQELLNEI